LKRADLNAALVCMVMGQSGPYTFMYIKPAPGHVQQNALAIA